MTLEKFFELLESTGFPVTYREWDLGDEPKFPYLVYYVDSETSFFADNKNYWSQIDLSVELYTEIKDPKSEKIVESIFEENGLLFEKQEYYWDEDDLHEVIYETRIHF